MTRPRVLLADDHTMLLDAFRQLLEPECHVVGMAADGRELVDLARETRPDIAVVDISMPRLNGISAGRQLREAAPETKLIYLTVNEDADLAAEAMELGASGYLLKRSASSELFLAIQEVLAGRTYVTPLVSEMLDGQEGSGRRGQRLTSRQVEVLQLLAEGNSMKEVAEALKITPRTVAFHKYRMMEVLGIRTSAQLVQFAVKRGIVAS